MSEFKFSWLPGNLVSPDNHNELASFYSNHYGLYSSDLMDNRRGKQIMLKPNAIKQYLNDSSELYTVREDGLLIGYAIVQKGTSSNKEEKIIWVTQFVVHKNYRNRGIGKELLFHIWCFSPYYAWGLLTANPYAIRALEKTTHRRCDPIRIKKNAIKLINFGEKHVWYINKTTERNIDDTISIINTGFPVDLSGLGEMLRNITDAARPWKLGDLIEGWEWFAFTFNDQNPIELSSEEIEKMLETSDSIVHEAYSRMPMDDVKQTWAQYTKPEIDFIISECELKISDKLLDIGCGMGRHSIELSNRGFTDIVGIDLIKNLIDAAKKKIDITSSNVKFKIGDISKKDIPELNEKYDCVLCLYDVIGSYANYDKNIQMIENISSLLRTGGHLILSVMNLHFTEHIAKNKFKLSVSTKELLSLPSSKTMETSGNVFDPDYFLLDTESKVVYRKEEFSPGSSIPKELIVRDRRFYKQEIEDMCTSFGLEVCLSKIVNAGWRHDMELTTGKEILLVCRKK